MHNEKHVQFFLNEGSNERECLQKDSFTVFIIFCQKVRLIQGFTPDADLLQKGWNSFILKDFMEKMQKG